MMSDRWKKESISELKILITGGGTGGHLFPAIAVAEEFRKRFKQCPILFVGAGRSMDNRALSGKGYDTKVIHCGGLKGGTFFSKIKTLVSLPLGLFEAMAIIRSFKPNLVFGVGGYVTGPVMLAAQYLGVPTCIHEQNSVPGLANRKLGKFVDKVFLSIPGSEKYFKRPCSLMGNPIRKEFLELREKKRQEPKGQVKEKKSLTLAVLGGSLGAHQLNILLPGVLAELHKKCAFAFELEVVHQTGADDCEAVRAAYKSTGLEARVAAFFDTMAEIIDGSDLIVCRAGATTLAELTALGKAAVLIPYPYAADDHQRKNGEYLVTGGAALMFRQEDLSHELLVEQLFQLCTNPRRMEEMAVAAERLSQPEAAVRIVDECCQMIATKKGL